LTLTVMAAVVGVIAGVILSNPVLDVLVTNSSADNPAAAAAAPGAGRLLQRGAFGGPAAAGTQGNTTGTGPNGALIGNGRFAPGGISRGVTNFGSALDNVRASVGFSIVLYGLLAAALIAIAGSAFPAYLIARVRPAEVMRSE
jgi:ABC-type antimicrobial peptide transport system permease subunit